MAEDTFLDHVRWTNEGLVPAIAQDHKTGKILMMAWMNKEALALTVAENIAVYWSRSRKALWRKGESSGHTQHVKAIQLDCDGDTIVLQVEQVGGIACHTGRQSCFFRHLENKHWVEAEPVLKDPKDMYA